MTSSLGSLPLDGELPELAGVAWRARVDERALARLDRRWTRSTISHLVPFLVIAAGMPLLSLVMLPVSVIALVFAWFIPSLWAARGAGVLRAPSRRRGGGLAVGGVADGGVAVGGVAVGGVADGGVADGGVADGGVAVGAEDRALGLLGDLVGHDARSVLSDTGFLVEPGRFGTWVVGPAGALLVRGGRARVRRAQCYCVRATGDDLPRADRMAHLLLALRADEAGFATVANLTFSGACWRIRRGLPSDAARVAIDAAIRTARARPRSTPVPARADD
jgi:hypothetical protein